MENLQILVLRVIFIVVGAVENGLTTVYARVFENISGTWIQIGSDIPGEASLDNSGFSVRLNENGRILIIGLPFNSEIGSNSGHVRIFKDFTPVSDTISVTSYDSYTVPSGDEVYTNVETYEVQDTLNSILDVDSILVINLTINTYDIAPQIVNYVNGELSISVPDVQSFQWVNCDNNFNALSGEIDSFYVPEMNGNYAVVVMGESCQDTSDCISINDVGFTSDLNNEFVTVYPNPTNDWLNVSSSSLEINNMTILTLFGEKVLTTNNSETNLHQLEKGGYLVKIEMENSMLITKVLLE